MLTICIRKETSETDKVLRSVDIGTKIGPSGWTCMILIQPWRPFCWTFNWALSSELLSISKNLSYMIQKHGKRLVECEPVAAKCQLGSSLHDNKGYIADAPVPLVE